MFFNYHFCYHSWMYVNNFTEQTTIHENFLRCRAQYCAHLVHIFFDSSYLILIWYSKFQKRHINLIRCTRTNTRGKKHAIIKPRCIEIIIRDKYAFSQHVWNRKRMKKENSNEFIPNRVLKYATIKFSNCTYDKIRSAEVNIELYPTKTKYSTVNSWKLLWKQWHSVETAALRVCSICICTHLRFIFNANALNRLGLRVVNCMTSSWRCHGTSCIDWITRIIVEDASQKVWPTPFDTKWKSIGYLDVRRLLRIFKLYSQRK